MIDILLDTNIVIYLFQKTEPFLSYVINQQDKKLGISIITFMEVLIGANDENEEKSITDDLKLFEIIGINNEIALKSAETSRQAKKSLRHPLLPDTLIAHTALHLSVPLMTNNAKDFRMFENLKLLVPSNTG